MAKTRAQRKAERRAREAQEARQAQSEGRSESEAQHDTQVGESGDIAEIKAVEGGMAAGAPESSLETPDAPTQPSPAERRALQKEEREKDKRPRADTKRQGQERPAPNTRPATHEH